MSEKNFIFDQKQKKELDIEKIKKNTEENIENQIEEILKDKQSSLYTPKISYYEARLKALETLNDYDKTTHLTSEEKEKLKQQSNYTKHNLEDKHNGTTLYK